ncbi:MAG: DUF58 domain-containing protein [Pseudomonadota bacterium]
MPEHKQLRRDSETLAAGLPPLLLAAERVAQTVASGLHGRRRAGVGETFWQHRPYTFPDPVSAIDWRQSARTSNRLYVRQNEWEAAAPIYIWRDASASLDYASSKNGPTKQQRADTLLLAAAILLAAAGERIGLIDEQTRTYFGRTAPARLLEAFAGQSPASNAPPLTPINAGATVFFISDFFLDSDALRAAIAHYAGYGARGVLLQVIDPAEEDFPFRGRTEFYDLETPSRLTIGDAASVRTDYRQRFEAHRETLRIAAARFGWSFLTHRTDKSPELALASLYAALSGEAHGNTAQTTPAQTKTAQTKTAQTESDAGAAQRLKKDAAT